MCLYPKNVVVAFIIEALFGAFIDTLMRGGEPLSTPLPGQVLA